MIQLDGVSPSTYREFTLGENNRQHKTRPIYSEQSFQESRIAEEDWPLLYRLLLNHYFTWTPRRTFGMEVTDSGPGEVFPCEP